jgi:hypothetical protein
MLGSRWSGPYCPGASVYSSDLEDGGKMCKGTMGEFKIDLNGNCDDDKGCSLAATGPVCPGVSRGKRDLKGGNRECEIDNRRFQIGPDGKCIDKSNCATSLTSAVKSTAKGMFNSASVSCPTGYTQDINRFITQEQFENGVRKVCKGSDDSRYAYQFIDGKGNVVNQYNQDHMEGKKKRSTQKMCYMRRSKGKTSRSKVCLDKAALQRLIKGARKGGRHSHKK